MNQYKSLPDDAIAIWHEGVKAVNAQTLVENSISVDGDQFSVGQRKYAATDIERIICVGFGKASGAMALGLEHGLADLPIPLLGLVSVPDDQVVKTNHIEIVGTRHGGKNLPTERVLKATKKILDLASSAGPNDLIVCLISGGGSALLELPLDIDDATTITLDAICETTRFLSSAGASIYELNSVRQSISQVKGGSLATASGGAPIVSLIISDVAGDPLDVIASGPTVAPSNKLDAIDILEKFDAERDQIPASVWHAVESKLKPEVSFPDALKVDNFVIGNVELAVEAARTKAVELGYACKLGNPNGNEGDAEIVGRQVALQILETQKHPDRRCIIQGGETTVELCQSPGQGGRNQHLVLSALNELTKSEEQLQGEFCLLSGGTDGEDGTNPVAGAIIDQTTMDHFQKTDSGEIQRALDQCNSFAFHQTHHTVLETSKTWTNVGDLRVLLTSNPIEKAI